MCRVKKRVIKIKVAPNSSINNNNKSKSMCEATRQA